MPQLSQQAKYRRRWARRIIRSVPDVPIYGSAEFLALPDGDRRKLASIVRAAECWARDADDFEWLAELQLEHHRRADDEELAAFIRSVADRPVRSTLPGGAA